MVEIPFDNEDITFFTHGLLGHPKAEKDFTLVINRRFRRIQIFGQRIIEDSSAKTDNTPMDILDRKQESIPETVIVPAPLPALDQSNLFRCSQRELFPLQEPRQKIPGFRGKAEPIGQRHLQINPTFFQVRSAGCT